ncbi:hypothetical protein QUC31_015666, partial [Theobroma cacao]
YEVYIYPNHAESVKGFGICHTSLLVVPNLITYPKSKTRFASAVLNNRRKVTSVYKPFCNDWLFLESCRKAVSKYPNIGYEEIIPEKCLMQLHSNLEIFDVLVDLTFVDDTGFLMLLLFSNPFDAAAFLSTAALCIVRERGNLKFLQGVFHISEGFCRMICWVLGVWIGFLCPFVRVATSGAHLGWRFGCFLRVRILFSRTGVFSLAHILVLVLRTSLLHRTFLFDPAFFRFCIEFVCSS